MQLLDLRLVGRVEDLDGLALQLEALETLLDHLTRPTDARLPCRAQLRLLCMQQTCGPRLFV